MQIERIMNDGNGFKLIAAKKELYAKKRKPYFSSSFLFDYKEGKLRCFQAYSNSTDDYNFNSFKAALKYILSL